MTLAGILIMIAFGGLVIAEPLAIYWLWRATNARKPSLARWEVIRRTRWIAPGDADHELYRPEGIDALQRHRLYQRLAMGSIGVALAGVLIALTVSR